MPTDSDPREPFPLRHIAEVAPRPPEAQWLVEPLWALAGVGIVGGCPKTGKTWLAAELALAVATGGSALGRFPARAQGPVIFFGAEDDQHAMRERFDAIAAARGATLAKAPVFLLDTTELRLDQHKHLTRLRATIASTKPRLLVLDPFVRLAKIDENSSQEVASVLGSLRAIQREFQVAILVAHHMRKSPASNLGQQLRGSGDFAAWADSTLYLTPDAGGSLRLSAEHRGAPAPPAIHLRLKTDGVPHLAIVDAPPHAPNAPAEAAPNALAQAILARLSASPRGISTAQLRNVLKVRKATLIAELEALRDRGLIRRSGIGWILGTDVDAAS